MPLHITELGFGACVGNQMKYHCHGRRDEVWTVVSDSGWVVIDDVERNVHPDDVVAIATGCKHTLIADTDMSWIFRRVFHRLSGHRKPHLTRHNFASGILLELSSYVKLASHRLRGKSLTNEANTSLCHLSRIKSVSDIRNIGFQFAGIVVSWIKNIHECNWSSD